MAYDPGTAYLEQILSDEIKVGSNVETPVEVKHQVTFDADGGVLTNAPTEYVEGVGLDTLPLPTKEGYNFVGWYLLGKEYNFNSVVTKDITFWCNWYMCSSDFIMHFFIKAWMCFCYMCES